MNINWIENSKLHCIAVFELFVFVCSLGVCVWLGAYVVSTWKIHKLCNGLCVCVCGGVLRSASDTSFHFFFFVSFSSSLPVCSLCTVHCTNIIWSNLFNLHKLTTKFNEHRGNFTKSQWMAYILQQMVWNAFAVLHTKYYAIVASAFWLLQMSMQKENCYFRAIFPWIFFYSCGKYSYQLVGWDISS